MRAPVGLTVLLVLMGAACRQAAPAAAAADRRVQAVLGDQQNELNTRRALLAALQPVTLKNCRMKRFGSANDGGYLLCENLLQDVKTAYWYGIGGNDDWGCEVSRRLKVPVHQYDCFEPPTMACPGGQFVPHNECVGPIAETAESRVFDTVQNQIARNGDSGRRLLVKMDIEGAEWKSLMATPDEILATFDQLPMELHGTGDPLFLEVAAETQTQLLPRSSTLQQLGVQSGVGAVPRQRVPGALRQQTRRHSRNAGSGDAFHRTARRPR